MMTGMMGGMPTPGELGERIRQARIRQHLSQIDVTRATKISRDTLRRIEAGGSSQDAKRQVVLDHLGLDADGLPLGEALSQPTPLLDVDARLANHDRQIDALWRRLDELGGGRSVDGHPAGGGPDATVTEFRPRTGPPEPPAEAPPIPDGLAADDPEEPTEYQRQHDADHGDDNLGR